MDDLLKPLQTAYRSTDQEEASLTEVETTVKLSSPSAHRTTDILETPSSPEHALEILKGEPNLNTLVAVLSYLSHSVSFSIPSPLTSQLINVLVTQTVPHYWAVLSGSGQDGKKHAYAQPRTQLLEILKTASGLGAIVTRLKALVEENSQTGSKKEQPSTQFLIEHLQILCIFLEDKSTLSELYRKVSPSASTVTQNAVWQEVAALLAGGRLLGIAAEAFNVARGSNELVENDIWVSNGKEYCQWMGGNLAFWVSESASDGANAQQWKAIFEVTRKSLRLGHPDIIQEELIRLALENQDAFKAFLAVLPKPDQKPFITSTIRFLARRYLPSEPSWDRTDWWKPDEKIVAGVASLLHLVAEHQGMGETQLIPWLTNISGAGPGESVGIRRAVVAVFGGRKNEMEAILEKCFETFGDNLYIKHTPSTQQEVLAQVLLLSAGYVYRAHPLKLKMLTRSALYLNAVSNRLAASSERARFLGMIVGEALSKLTDAEGKQMDFKMGELQTSEAKWYKSLVHVCDRVGSISDLPSISPSMVTPMQRRRQLPVLESRKPVRKAQNNSKVISIEELEDDEDDDGLTPYAKPDSDAEDSDDDPTLITRNKPVAPVYIRDLIAYLRDVDNYDRQKLALSSAASLIRRKAGFGSEVKDHTEELASLLVGLQNKYEIDDFNELRLQGMIAVLVSDPTKMAKWYSKTFFDGDYSVAQRSSVLSTIIMAARELGGLAEEDREMTDAPATGAELFPSKRLPGRMHQIYGGKTDAVDALTEKMSKAMIQPLAAQLADRATGPNVLKVRTFSSRLEVESRRAAPTTNKLSAIAADSFFYPLTGRFFAHLKAYGGRNVIFESYLLSSFVKTLSLLLHASGKNTLQLPQMTREFWDLLLALRTHAVGDKAVSEALLFGFMTILEINEDKRRLSEQHGRELMETQKWVEAFFQGIGTGGSEEEKLQQLAAGVLFKIREVVKKYQALLMGDLASY